MLEIIIYPTPGTDAESVSDLLEAEERIWEENGSEAPSVIVSQPSELHACLKSVLPERHKICIIFVIQKGRIKEEIHRLPKKELELIFSGTFPVILLLTGCNYETDLDWWTEHHSSFEPYGILNRFDSIIHGTTDTNPHTRRIRRSTQESLVVSVIEFAREVDPNALKLFYFERFTKAWLNIRLHFCRHKFIYIALIPCILLPTAAWKFFNSYQPPNLEVVGAGLTLEQVSDILRSHVSEIANLQQRVEADALEIAELKLQFQSFKVENSGWHEKIQRIVTFISDTVGGRKL